MKPFDEIYFENYEILLRFISKRVGEIDGRDLVQEVFLKFWKRYSKAEDINSHRAYLFQMSRSVIFDHLKSKRKEISLSTALEEGEQFLKTDDPEFLYLENILKNLPRSDQVLLELRFVYDLKFSEISKIIRKSEGAVKMNFGRILKKLRNSMKDNEISSEN